MAHTPSLAVTYPSDLPVSQQRPALIEAITNNQVVIVAGETGSGKTTQLPKMLLELGYGASGRLIGHTQPRRIAARSVAARIAFELGEKLGEGTVGYQVRFTKQTASGARLKVMTDGILLSEIQHDRMLKKYDAVIIDEAHERSLTIDMLLGYLKRIARRRPELKIIITSATIDPERFAEFFSTRDSRGALQPAPIIEVSGRTYPVEIRYRPLVLEADEQAVHDGEFRSYERDLTQAVIEAVDELAAEGPGDILTFLPGEREIREISDELLAHVKRTGRASRIDVLPLYGRLSEQDQQKIFSPPAQASVRRVVLATNVAETSLTVPGIKYVIDSGLARISRYSQRTKVQRLPIEEISQASAIQRSGRSGRTAPGIAIRLYSEDNFHTRDQFTEPEILRTSLASVVLHMTALGLGDIESFDFVQAPEAKAVRDGVRLLEELGAITSRPSAPGGRALTEVGTIVSRFPLDPRMARMLIEASTRGALREVLVIVAALSIADPRERPLDATAQAEQMHARFQHESSDFLTLVNLWNHLRERRRELSNSAFKREVKAQYLHYVRIREWWDIHAQLSDMCRDAGLRPSDNPASEAAIHQSLLSGLLSHVGLYDERTREYQGARGARFVVWPGSVIARKRHDYVMAAELVETSRLFGRVAAAVDPRWIEELGAHVLKRSYSQPHWSSSRASAMAYEKLTLFGITIAANRRVSYAKVDPELSREIFIHNALVEGSWKTRHHFLRDNQALMSELEELENKTRRRDLIVGPDELFQWYDARIPATVVSARHFDSWWKKARHSSPRLLHLSRDDLLVSEEAEDTEGFPDAWVQGDVSLPLTYAFTPSDTHAHDGVTVHIPLAVLGRVEDAGFDWLVPGLREEKIAELIRTLPKPLRRHLIPAPDKARAVAAVLRRESPQPGERFVEAVADELVALDGVPDDLHLYGDEFDEQALPQHLRMHFAIVDHRSRVIARGDDLSELKARHRGRMEVSAAKHADSFGEHDIDAFPRAPIARTRRSKTAALSIIVYPALKLTRDNGRDRIDLTALASHADQEREHPQAVIALINREMAQASMDTLASLPNPTKVAITQSGYGGAKALAQDAALAATTHLVRRSDNGGLVFTLADFEALREQVRREHARLTEELMRGAVSALAAHASLSKALGRVRGVSVLQQLTSIRDHAARLVEGRFVSRTDAHVVPELARYLKASEIRLEKLQENPARDAQLAWQVQELENLWKARSAVLDPSVAASAKAREIPWMIEELRVSFFAQQLGTRYSVSDKRVRKAIAELG